MSRKIDSHLTNFQKPPLLEITSGSEILYDLQSREHAVYLLKTGAPDQSSRERE